MQVRSSTAKTPSRLRSGPHCDGVKFTIGTLRELGMTLKDLRSATGEAGSTTTRAALRGSLFVNSKRGGDRDKFFRKMRNVAAFHIDKKIIDAGLTKMLKDSGVSKPLAEGDGGKNFRSQMPSRNADAPRRIVLEQSR